jgi:hypothetical protein
VLVSLARSELAGQRPRPGPDEDLRHQLVPLPEQSWEVVELVPAETRMC